MALLCFSLGIVVHCIPYRADFDFAQSCLEGDEVAIGQLQQRYGAGIRSFLIGTGASIDESEEIVCGLWADCLVAPPGSRPRIAKYGGVSSLKTWLNAVALNILLTRKRQETRRNRLMPQSLDAKPQDEHNGQKNGLAREPEATPAGELEEPLIDLLRKAIDCAFAQCRPDHYVLLQLAHCESLRLVDLAGMWNCSQAKISRMLNRASKEVAGLTLDHIRTTDRWLDLKWSDFVDLCRSASPSCFARSERE